MNIQEYAALAAEFSNTIIYVSDTESHEIYYLNDLAKEIIGVVDDSYVGAKCYELIQGKNAPCEFCTNSLLKENEFYEWEFYHPNFERYYSLHDTLKTTKEGKKVRIEYAVDITNSKQKYLELQKDFVLEQAQLQCLKIFQYEPDIEISTQKFIEIIAQFYGANRAYIFNFDYAQEVMIYAYEYCKEGIEPQIDIFKSVPLTYAEDWLEMFYEKGEFYITDTDEYSGSEKAKEILQSQGIRSLMAAPIMVDGKISGFLGVDDPSKYFDDFALLRSTTFFICEERKKYVYTKTLETLSYMDTLTNVYNRNKFFSVIGDMQQGAKRNIGICFTDINELKKQNDMYGHEVGDELIRQTVNTLKQVFEGSIYRIGGDEFVVLCFDIKKEVFNEKMQQLRALLESTSGINISVGDLWVEHTDKIEAEITKADHYMYEEKQNYYRTQRNSAILHNMEGEHAGLLEK